MFKSGSHNCKDSPRPGRPSKVTPEIMDTIQMLLEDDKTLSVKKIAEICGLSVGTIHHVLRKRMQLTKRPARWVPHDLTPNQMRKRKAICQDLIHMWEDDLEMLDRVVTADESWFFTYDPSNRQITASWLKKGQKRPQKPRLNRFAQKVMLVVFWDVNGIIHREFIPRGHGIGAELYLQILKHLRAAMGRRRPE